jgi:hypothetical protein
MDDATCGGLVVEPQNHSTTISMGLVSKPGCVVSEEIRGGMWSHRGWYIKAKQLRERSMFVKSSKLELVHFITSCVDKFYVFRRYVGNLKIPSINKEEGLHQPTISLAFVFTLHYHFVRRSLGALIVLDLCTYDFGKCGLNHTYPLW